MIRRLVLIAAILWIPAVLHAQNNGALLPALPPTFHGANGAVASGGRLCTTASGSSTNLATYSNAALTSALPNPITLSSVGVPTTGGGASTAIYLQAASYRITLYAAGTGNTCNGTAVGAQVWQRDGVYDFALLQTLDFTAKFIDNVCHAAAFTGTTPNDASGKIVACINALPSTGGVVDARGLEGAQTLSVNVFAGVTKNVELLLGAGTYTVSSTQTYTNPYISIKGLGPFVTILNCTVNADCIQATSNPWTVNMAGTISDLTMQGQNTTNADASGIHASGIIGLKIRNVTIVDFDGTNSAGLWLDHGASFAANGSGPSTANFVERTGTSFVHLDYNRIGLKLTAQAAAFSSFFTSMDLEGLYINVDSGQHGIHLIGTNNAGIIQSTIAAYFNCINGGTMVHLSASAVFYDSMVLNIVGETTSGTACVGLDVDSGSIFIYEGVIDVKNGSSTSAIDGVLIGRLGRNEPGATYGNGFKNMMELDGTIAARTTPLSGGYGSYVHKDTSTPGGFRQGIGQNVYFDGTNWIALGNGVANRGAGWFFDGNDYCNYVSPTTGGTNNTISNAGWTTYQRLCVSDGGVRFGTVAGAGTPITFHISATGSHDFGTINANLCADVTFVLNGSLDTDSLYVNVIDAPPAAGIMLNVFGASSSAPTVRACNITTGNVAVGVLNLRVDAWRH